jgi:hypothetical protein
MSEWTNVPAEVRQNYACKVCSNYPDEEGVLDHGRGCYMIDENGGGSEYVDPPEHLPQHATPAPLKPLEGDERSEKLLKIAEGETAVADKAFAELCAVWQIENTPLRQSIFRAGARHSIELITLLKSHGMPDDAEPGEWVVSVVKERDQARRAIESFGNNPNGFDWAFLTKLEDTEDALTAAEARAAEAEKERDSANAACNEVLNSLEWSGDGYEWNPPNGDYRESPMVALSRGQRKHVAALTAAQARIAELEGLLQRIESNARNALLSLGVSEADVETPDPVFSLTVLAKPQRFGYVQGYVDALTAAAALAAAALAAAAVGERCEENT